MAVAEGNAKKRVESKARLAQSLGHSKRTERLMHGSFRSDKTTILFIGFSYSL